MARHAVPFGTVDPILGRDVSFYIFQLPFLQFLHNLAFITVLLSALGVAAAHLRRPEPRGRSAIAGSS